MKYTLYSVLVFVVLAGIPAFLQEKRSHIIITETVSKAWHQRDLEKRAVLGAKAMRYFYELTPAQTIHFESVVASRDGDICYVAESLDARRSPEMVFAFFERGAKDIRYNLSFTEFQSLDCGGPGSRDLPPKFVPDATFPTCKQITGAHPL